MMALTESAISLQDRYNILSLSKNENKFNDKNNTKWPKKKKNYQRRESNPTTDV